MLLGCSSCFHLMLFTVFRVCPLICFCYFCLLFSLHAWIVSSYVYMKTSRQKSNFFTCLILFWVAEGRCLLQPLTDTRQKHPEQVSRPSQTSTRSPKCNLEMPISQTSSIMICDIIHAQKTPTEIWIGETACALLTSTNTRFVHFNFKYSDCVYIVILDQHFMDFLFMQPFWTSFSAKRTKDQVEMRTSSATFLKKSWWWE